MPRHTITMSFELESKSIDLPDIKQIMLSTLNTMVLNPVIEEVAFASDNPASEKLVVYTDGGCYQKSGVGAWAFTAHEGTKQILVRSGAMLSTTNNRMELMAVIQALEVLEIGRQIIVNSDSKYVVQGATSWAKNWQKYGWMTVNKTPVLNKDLWRRLLALTELHSVEFNHIKGHAGNAGNEYVDELCTAEMMKAFNELGTNGHAIQVDQKEEASAG